MMLLLTIINVCSIDYMSQNSDIVVDLDLWLMWLERLHYAFPDMYNDPVSALNGFYEDWNEYLTLIKHIKEQ